MNYETISGDLKICYADQEVIERILNGEKALFELLVRRTNPRLYRIGRSFGFDHDDTQDLMQEAHVDAYLHLGKFEHRSSYATWITRLMINRCAQRSRRKDLHTDRALLMREDDGRQSEDPLSIMMKKEMNSLLERIIEDIPINHRLVFTLRELEGWNVAQTAGMLGLTENNVKVRLNRARAMIKEKLKRSIDPKGIYQFNLIYCDTMVERVMDRIRSLPLP